MARENECNTSIHSPGVTACQLNPWLGGDKRSGRLKTWGGAAWPPGLAAILALLSNRFAEAASMSWVLPCAALESRAWGWS